MFPRDYLSLKSFHIWQAINFDNVILNSFVGDLSRLVQNSHTRSFPIIFSYKSGSKIDHQASLWLILLGAGHEVCNCFFDFRHCGCCLAILEEWIGGQARAVCKHPRRLRWIEVCEYWWAAGRDTSVRARERRQVLALHASQSTGPADPSLERHEHRQQFALVVRTRHQTYRPRMAEVKRSRMIDSTALSWAVKLWFIFSNANTEVNIISTAAYLRAGDVNVM